MANQKKLKLSPFKFKPFSDKQMKVLNWWTESSPVNDAFMLIADGAIRSGKASIHSSILYTPDGYKTMGEIKIGDYVFNRVGKPVKVVGVFPQGKLDVYEIEFHDGSKTICSEDHLWTYTSTKCITNGNKTMFTSTLGEIMQDLERFRDRKHMHQRAGKYRFPLNGCVEFNSKEVKIDPYLLGLLIGDGCFSEGNSGITFINEEDTLHKYIEEILPTYDMNYKITPRKGIHCAYGSLRNNIHGIRSKLREFLEEYSLYGCKSHNKFIPVDYKYNSKETRLQILAGILNTDGSALNNRPSISYCTVSKQLFDDVAEVARSLGMFVNTDRKVDTREKNKHDCYSLCIRVSEDLYALLSEKHKNRLNMEATKSKEWRLIKSITYVGKEDCQCIYVDDEEHLYLTDDFIVTHNTVSMSLSFVLFVMNTFNQQNAAMAGKSVGSFRRNVLVTLKQMLMALDYEIIEHRSENYLEIIKGEVTNYFYIFGGRDESSQDLIQGRLCRAL
jgi:hypothetical protein|nr:MAG TPA: large terminase [Caudoviricetes sp.]